MIRTLLLSAAALGLAGTAFAGTTFTATLETPMDKAEKIVAAKAVWVCSGTTCIAELNRKTVNLGTCKKVVRKLGKVSEFSSTTGALTEEQVATCNESAK